jgi:glucose-1-phosphate thymidylyltransferase
MKGVLLCGGRGTRLRPITHTGPKQLIPIANKPVIQYAIEDFRQAGITEIGIVLGNLGRTAVQKFLGDGSGFGVDITYIVQGNPLGIAHAIGCCRDFVGDDDFVVYLGDNMLKQNLNGLVESYERGDYSGGIALQKVDNPERFGVATLDDKGDVVKIREKPDDPSSNTVIIGVYVFSPVVFDYIEELEPSARGELEVTDAFQALIDDSHRIDSQRVSGWWKDTGKPEDIIEANRLVLDDLSVSTDGTVEKGAEMMGKVDLHETAIIDSGAVVRGPVSIAEGTVIESGTYLGPYTSIGPQSVVRGTHIENTVVVGESTVETEGKIVDSLIGRGAQLNSAADYLPEGRRLVVGENSSLKL